MTPEGYTKKFIKELLDYLGAYHYMPVPGGFGKQTVDFLVCLRGTFVAIEAKRPGKKATPLQELVMVEIRKAGGVAFATDSIFDCVEQLHKHFVFDILPREMTVRWRKHYEKDAA